MTQAVPVLALDGPIRYYNRYSGEMETEEVYGEAFLRWAYGNPLGRLTVSVAVKRLWFSQWYGWMMDRPSSQKKIAPFIREYAINTKEMLDAPDSFGSFNEFFYRRLKPEARPVAEGDEVAVFPADGRHLAIPNLQAAKQFYLKGQRFDLRHFLGSADLAASFEGGSLLISRLCPVDYHRYHFPVGGYVGSPTLLEGSLRSVSPLALRRRLSILWENRRMRTVVESPVFGSVVVMEIGATCVGGMHSTCDPGSVCKGQEKGYFSFGGSCVATLFRPGSIRFDDDLITHSTAGYEVYARMGDHCGLLMNQG